jgi:hypothetical protein
VGPPPVDLLAEAVVHTVACDFADGDRRTKTWSKTMVGWLWLVARLVALFQGGRTHLPKTDEAAGMRQELLDDEIRVDEDANDRHGVFRIGSHDDPVTALGPSVGVEDRI